jgi:hypothetical protein
MPESESFDAFYARTVRNVTSQMHALADQDGLADHAIREAYARAYQQWYEVSGYRDSEAWVLGVAKDAYERRRAEATGVRDNGRLPGHDPLSWPGMFRPAPPKAAAVADPELPLAPRPGSPAGPGVAGAPGVAASADAFGGPDLFGNRGAAGSVGNPAVVGSPDALGSPDAAGSPRVADNPGAFGSPGGAGTADGPGAAAGPSLVGGTGVPGSPVGAGGPAGAGGPGAAAGAGLASGAGLAGDVGLVGLAAAVQIAAPTVANPAEAGPMAAGPVRTEVPPGSLFGSPAASSSSPTADWVSPAASAHGGDATYGAAATGNSPVGWGAPAGPTPTSRITDYAGARPASRRSWTSPSGRGIPSLLRSRRNLIAVAVAAAILVAGVIVYATGSQSPRRAASPGVSAKAVAKPTVHMLPAGRTGNRASIPWSLVGSGWTLAEISTAQPDANGAAGGGRYVTYLVDPEGGRYRTLTTSGSTAPSLLAWSGDARTALYAVGGTNGRGATGYKLLTVDNGQLSTLTLPTGVTALGFTRPDGLNILAIRQKQDRYLLQRYNLAGGFQATIGSLPRPAGALDVLQGNALSSPDGDTAVWGIIGHDMQLVSNAGGLIRRLRVPAAGTPPACTPISWWSTQTVLAYCNAVGVPDAGRLWLVPTGGGPASALTGISGSPSGIGDLTGAWQAGGAVYLTATTAAQCQPAASGPGGQQILLLGQSGAETAVSLPGSTDDRAAVVAGVGSRLLVLAQTSCPGTSSLIWFNPSTHAAQTVLTAPATEVGVVAAVAYGSGSAAAANG